jgi:amino acid adenylation domain-containing protein
LLARASRIAATLERLGPSAGAPVTAAFAYRTPTAFAAVLGALLRGHAYVALNRRFPPERSRLMLERADARTVVVDRASADQLDAVVGEVAHELVVLMPDHDDVSDFVERWPNHRFVPAGEIVADDDWTPRSVAPDDIAYLIFTSGSTGTPKTVQVPHGNIRRYVDLMIERWEVTEHDRLSQTFDMTFDLSVNDMFVAWERGACLCCLPAAAVMKPGKFIRESGITVWYAVPSVGLFMKRLGMLKPGAYPGLRLVLFCGEPLPLELAQAWAEAAPNAIVENVYGPTEVTITCAVYRFDPARTPAEAEFGVVPIGSMYPGMQGRVVDESLQEVPPGEVGELLLTGPQVTPGYWRDPERSAGVFIRLPGETAASYRTGDRVRRPVGDGPLTYLGRIDFQVKVSGHRVELGEVEDVLRHEAGSDEVVVVGWPRTETGYSGLVAFVQGDRLETNAVRAGMAARLPEYMVPREIRLVAEMPLTVTGKFDRKALAESLEPEV